MVSAGECQQPVLGHHRLIDFVAAEIKHLGDIGHASANRLSGRWPSSCSHVGEGLCQHPVEIERPISAGLVGEARVVLDFVVIE